MNGSERVPISKKIVLINSVSNIATRLLLFGVFGWAIQLLIKRVPDEELALLPVVISLTLLVPVIQSVLTSGLGRYVTEAYARNELHRVTEIVSSIFPWLLATAAAVLTLGAMLAWQIPFLLSIPPENLGQARGMLLLVVFRMAVGLVLAAHNTGIFAKQAFVFRNLIEVSGACLQIALLVGLLLGVGAQVHWVVVAQVAAQLWVLVCSSVISVRLIPELRFRWSAIDKKVGQEVIGFGGWYSIGQLSNTIRRAADAPILHRLASAVDVNTFFLGSFIEDQIRRFIDLASQSLSPALTAMHAAGERSRLAAAYLRGGRIGTWVAMFLAVPLLVFREDIFRLYLGDRYAEHAAATTVLALLLAGFPITYPTRMLYAISAATAQVRPVTIRSIVGAAINLAITLVFVGVLGYGAIGSAAATLISFALIHPFLQWPLAMRMLEISRSRFFTDMLLPGLVPTVATIPIALLLRSWTGGPSLWLLLANASVCVTVYVVAMALVLKPADRADVARVLIALGLRSNPRLSG